MPAAVAAAAGPAALAALEPPQPMAPQQQPLAPGLSPMKGGGCGGSLGPSVLTADNPRRVSAEAVSPCGQPSLRRGFLSGLSLWLRVCVAACLLQ